MKKFVFIIISGVIVLAFAFFGLTPALLGGGAGRGIALSVNDEVVSTISFDNIVRSASKRQSAKRAKTSKERRLRQARLRQQLLNELVQLNIAYVTLAESGFYTSSLAVIDQVLSTSAFSENGQFKRTRYESLLKSIGQTSESFESQIEKSLVFQRFAGWMGQVTESLELENSLKESVLDLEVHLDLFELKRPESKKKALVKAFDKKLAKIKGLLASNKSKSIMSWKKKESLKLFKSEKVSLLSSYLPVFGQNETAYKNILETKSKNFVKTLVFHKGTYYLVYVKAVKKAKAGKENSSNLLSQWFARQRQQVAMQTWFTYYSKDLNIYRNQNLIKL